MSDGIASRFDAVSYPGADERLLDCVMLHPGSALLGRAGRRPGPGLEVTIGGTPEAVTVAAGGGVITETALGGSYTFAIPAPVSINLPARPSVGNSRIDYVVVRILDEGTRPGDLVREPDVYLLQGVASASPTAPTIPAGHLRLARLDVPASGTIAISQAAPRTAAAGGLLIVADAAERNAISPLYDGLQVYNEALDVVETHANGGWAHELSRTATGSITTPVSGAWGDITGFEFQAEAGGIYGITADVFIINNTSNSPGWKAGFSWTGTGEMTMGLDGVVQGVSAPAYSGSATGVAANSAASPLRPAPGFSAPQAVRMLARVKATYFAATDGLVKMQHAQQSSHATAVTTVLKGSELTVKRRA